MKKITSVRITQSFPNIKNFTMNKTKRIEIRLNLFDEKLIRVKAQDCGLPVSEYVRRCALNKSVPKSLNSDELEVYKDLKKFYNNFSSISNLFKKGDHVKMVEEIQDLKREIKKQLEKINNGQ